MKLHEIFLFFLLKEDLVNNENALSLFTNFEPSFRSLLTYIFMDHIVSSGTVP